MAFKFYTGGKLIVREGDASFSPANLSSLNLWLDANDSSKIAVSAPNIVSTVTDKSSNGYVFNVGGPGSVGTNIGNMNGLNTIEFDGSSYLLSSTPFIIGNNFSMFVVAEIDSVNSVNDSLISMGSGSGPNWQIDAGGGSSNFNIRLFGGNLTTKNFSASHEPGPAIFEFVFNLSAGTAEVLLDGVSLGTTPYSAGTAASNLLSIFANRALSQRIDGRVGEVIATSSVLTNTQRQKVEGYLAERWGLSLPNSHPYKDGFSRATTFYINRLTSGKLAQEYSFNISIRDTQANILNRNNDPVGTIAYATDTFNLLVKQVDGYDEFTVVDDDDRDLGQYSFNIDIRLTRGQILARNNDPVGTIAYATDTSQILIKQIDGYDSFTLLNPPYSLEFDGVDDYLDTNSNFQSTFKSDFTISTWFKDEATGTSPRSFFGIRKDNSPKSEVLSYTDGSQITMWVRYNDTRLLANFGHTRDSSWHHYVFKVNQNGGDIEIRGYLDGVLKLFQSEANTMSSYSNTGNLTIGARNYDISAPDTFFKGKQDEFAIFESALSDGGVSVGETAGGDIRALYSGGVMGDISSLNPVAWYRMGNDDNASGTTITDMGSGQSDGTLINGPTFSDDTREMSAGTRFKNEFSVDLDGTSAHISIPSSTDFDFGTSAFSFSMWFNITDEDDFGGLFFRSSGYRIKFQNNDQDIKMEIGNFRPLVVQHGSSLLNAWHHLVIVGDRAENKIKGYLDGGSPLESNMASSVSLSASGQPLLIGQHLTYYLDGLVDEFSIFDYALSAADVANIYNSGVPNDLGVNGLNLSPVGWWRMGDSDGGEGTTITDQGSGGNDGTLVNSATFSTNVPAIIPTWEDNQYSVSVDGVDNYIDAGDKFDFIQKTCVFTISAWIKVDNVDADALQAFIDSSGSGAAHGVYLYFDNRAAAGSAKNLTVLFSANSVNTNIEVANGVIDNNWHHYAVTCTASGGTLSLYKDGSLLDSTTAPTTTTSSADGNLRFGSATNNSAYLDGSFDEVAIFDTALSASNITSIYNNGFPNDISLLNPVSWWRMGDNNNGLGTTVTDQGSGGNDATLMNGTIFKTSTPADLQYVYINGRQAPPQRKYFLSVDKALNLTGASSFSWWFNAQEASANTTFPILRKGGFFIDLGNNRIRAFFSDAATEQSNTLAEGSVRLGRQVNFFPVQDEWVHVVVTYDGSKLGTGVNFYLNGTKMTSTNGFHETTTSSSFNTFSTDNTNDLEIGARTLVNQYRSLFLNEVSIFNSELTESDIATLYNNGTPNNISSLNPFCWWRMNGVTAGTAIRNEGTSSIPAQIEGEVEFYPLPIPDDRDEMLNFLGNKNTITISGLPESTFNDSRNHNTSYKYQAHRFGLKITNMYYTASVGSMMQTGALIYHIADDTQPDRPAGTWSLGLSSGRHYVTSTHDIENAIWYDVSGGSPVKLSNVTVTLTTT